MGGGGRGAELGGAQAVGVIPGVPSGGRQSLGVAQVQRRPSPQRRAGCSPGERSSHAGRVQSSVGAVWGPAGAGASVSACHGQLHF